MLTLSHGLFAFAHWMGRINKMLAIYERAAINATVQEK